MAYKRRKLLTHEEEIRLGREMHSDNEEISSRAREEFVLSNLGLVSKYAHYYSSHIFSRSKAKKDELYEELFQEGIIGLCNAVDRYDPERGCRFGSYAIHSIMRAMTRRINQHISVIKKSEAFIKKELKAKRNGENTVSQLLVASLDSLVADDNSHHNFMQLKHQEMPYDAVERRETKEFVYELLSHLKAREDLIIRSRYGLKPFSASRLKDILDETKSQEYLILTTNGKNKLTFQELGELLILP